MFDLGIAQRPIPLKISGRFCRRAPTSCQQFPASNSSPGSSRKRGLRSRRMCFASGVRLAERHSPLQGRTHGGGARDPGPPWDLKNTIFSVFLPLNYVTCNFEVCFFFSSFLLFRKTEEACSMVNSLRKVDFSHPTGHYT